MKTLNARHFLKIVYCKNIYKMFLQYLAEFFGSVILVYVLLKTQNVLATGAIYFLLIIFTIKFSGGLFNPMITIIIAMLGSISKTDMFLYILAQILGGIIGMEIYKQTSHSLN